MYNLVQAGLRPSGPDQGKPTRRQHATLRASGGAIGQHAPRHLTPLAVMRLQRAIGNRGVGQLVKSTLQRYPKQDAKDPKLYHDHNFTDVDLQELEGDCNWDYYRILNDGPHKGTIIYFDTDKQAYLTTKQDDSVRGGIMHTETVFDLSVLSSLTPAAPAAYRGIGEQGQGVGYVERDTTLHTSGLISCVGWLLYNDNAAYLTHIYVKDPAIVRGGGLAEQVKRLCAAFYHHTGTQPTGVVIQVDAEQPGYRDDAHVWMSKWMLELVPTSCTAQWRRGTGELTHTVKASTQQKRVEWKGDPINLTYQ